MAVTCSRNGVALAGCSSEASSGMADISTGFLCSNFCRQAPCDGPEVERRV